MWSGIKQKNSQIFPYSITNELHDRKAWRKFQPFNTTQLNQGHKKNHVLELLHHPNQHSTNLTISHFPCIHCPTVYYTILYSLFTSLISHGHGCVVNDSIAVVADWVYTTLILLFSLPYYNLLDKLLTCVENIKFVWGICRKPPLMSLTSPRDSPSVTQLFHQQTRSAVKFNNQIVTIMMSYSVYKLILRTYLTCF